MPLQPDLSFLTTAHANALIDPEGCSREDYADALCADLVIPTATIGGCTLRRRRTDKGEILLAEAERLANGLTPKEVRHLAYAAESTGERHTLEVDVVKMLVAAGLVQAGRDLSGRYRCDILPAGELVLTLREGGKVGVL